jgi:hypothetical protein
MSDGQRRDFYDESGRYQGRSEPDHGEDTGFWAELRAHYIKKLVLWTFLALLVIVFLICWSCSS